MTSPAQPMIETAPAAGTSSNGAGGTASPGGTTAGGGTAAVQASQMKRTDEAITSTQAAVAASTAISQLEASFSGVADNRFVAAALRAAPLFLMKSPPSKEGGFWGLLSEPRTWGIAALVGIVGAKEVMQKAKKLCELRFPSNTAELEEGTQIQLHLNAYDESGGCRPAGDKVTFSTTQPHILDITSEGVVTARAQGTANVIAKLDEKTDILMVKVTPPQGHHETAARGRAQSTA